MSSFGSRLKRTIKHAWNAFTNRDFQADTRSNSEGVSFGGRPDRVRVSIANERSILSAIILRIAIDVSSVEIRHVRKDENGRYLEDIDSGMNTCLTLEANIDQAATAFRQDLMFTIFDRGSAAIVPVDTTINPAISGSFDIKTMRIGEIEAWFPQDVRVQVYNEAVGRREPLTLGKRTVAVIENPLYAVMNEPNSTFQRLIRKLNLLDAIDEQSASGKLDLIIQLPYVVKSEARRQQAEQRRKDIEVQLKGSKYGIAYTDGTEKITQLNRPAENNLLEQIKFLTEMLYTQLGVTPEVMNGTADEAAMLNYQNRTVVPLVEAMVQAMRRTFLTATARTQKQDIMYFKDPFKLVPVSQIAEIADKFVRNQIASANDIRQIVGWKPSKDPKADQLNNPNMPASAAELPTRAPLRVPSSVGTPRRLTAAPSELATRQR
jgi:hypothetical protein